jgi:hypothetical protein
LSSDTKKQLVSQLVSSFAFSWSLMNQQTCQD